MNKERSKSYKVDRITDSVWHLADSDFAIFYLVAGKEKAVLIDTGFGTGSLPSLCNSLTQLPIEVVLTHAHPDHIMGSGQFDRVMIGQADIPLLEYFFSPESREDTSTVLKNPKFKVLPKEQTDTWGEQTLKTIIPLSDGDTIDLGERLIRVISTPGHTTGSVCLLDEKDGFLFSGDTILRGNHLINQEESAPPEVFMDSLNRIQALSGSFKTILAGHEPSVLPKSKLTELLSGVNDILAGKLKGTFHKTVVGPGVKYRFGDRNSVICK